MTNQVSYQTQRRLANDLCLNVLRAMKHHAIIAYSFVSKKALALVQSLALPIKSVRIIMTEDPVIEFEFRNDFVSLELEMDRKNKKMASVNDFPLNVDVREGDEGDLAVDISNQGMRLGEWFQHLCSISKNVKVYEADFYLENMKLDIQSVRNVLPNLRRIGIHGSRNQNSEHETLNARKVLEAFIPYVKEVELFNVNLGENLSLQHIGIANLEILGFVHPKNFNFDFPFTLNAESCRILTDQMPLRDLNRFFKLWIKGSNSRLKELMIWCDMETVPDYNVLIKGLRVEEIEEEVDDEDEDGELEEREQEEESEVESEEEDVEEVEESEVSGESEESDRSESETESDEELEDEEVGGEGKKFLIRNCRGITGQIEVKLFEGSASVTFIVPK